MFPHAVVTSTTATGDVITGPGVPTRLIMGMPVSVVGDMVSGAACVGATTASTCLWLWMGRPANVLNTVVSGANPATGVPVATTVAVTTATTQLA